MIDDDFLRAYAAEQERCAICWRRGPVQVHHLVKRSCRRVDDAWNLLAVCWRCHASCELELVVFNGVRWPVITFAAALWVKRESGLWEPELLAWAYRRALPELEELPAEYEHERERNRIGYALPTFDRKPNGT